MLDVAFKIEPVQTSASLPQRLACENSIHLWLAFETEITDGALLGRLGLLLSASERLQHQRFRGASDRHRYLVTRALVRTVLSRYVPIEPDEWVFASTAYGKPEIAASIRHRCPDAEGLCFNISHTDGLVVVAVSQRRALGVDVETLPLRASPEEVVANFFSPSEREAFARTPASIQAERFGEYWTFKESYIKARGRGLSLGLDRFTIHFRDERRVDLLNEAPIGENDCDRWLFWQFRPTAKHLLAVCSESHHGVVPTITLMQAVPTQSEQYLDLPLLRRSARVSLPSDS